MDRTVLAAGALALIAAAAPPQTPAAHASDVPTLETIRSIGTLLPPPSLDALSPANAASIFAQRVLDPGEKKPEEEDRDKERPFPGLEGDERAPEAPAKLKNPWVAMGLSAVLPGAGQFYVDRTNLFSFAFVGVEAIAWYLHFQWDSDGEEKTREFERYAWTGDVDPVSGAPRNDILRDEGHWSWERWRDSFGDPQGCLQPTNIDYAATDSTLVQFWFENRREFYEDIGKYDKYDCGWLSGEFRDIYRGMRNETNDILERARLMTQVVLLNHISSSIHAFFLARSHNTRVEGTLSDLNWNFAPDERGGGLRAHLVYRKRF